MDRPVEQRENGAAEVNDAQTDPTKGARRPPIHPMYWSGYGGTGATPWNSSPSAP